MFQGDERRRSCRHPARADLVRVEWHDGESLRRTPGRLVDIGAGGAALRTDVRLPAEGPIWLQLVDFPTLGWVSAGLAWEDASGASGVAFHAECSFEMHRSVTLGIAFDHLLDGPI